MATTHVTTIGSGEHVVLCLHGWFGSAEGWGFLPHLVDTDSFTYVFPDNRGYGDRRTVAGEFTMEEVAADALAVADTLGVDRFSLLGHSMGGKAAAYTQVLAPERVRCLVGVNPVSPAPVPLDEDGRALFFGAADSPDYRRAIIDFTTGNRHPGSWLRAMTEHSTGTSERDAFAAYAESWITGDFSHRVVGCEVPVRLIVGEHDPALSATVMEQTWMQWYPKATLVTLPASGHYPMFETPVALVGETETFLSQH